MTIDRRTCLFALLAGAASLAGCGSGPERTRCARCGMYVDLSPAFAAHAGARAYDTPKCLFRDVLDGKAARAEAVVTEYYTQQRIPADSARYVVGSDILGPMGADLVPVAAADAQRFADEHGGRLVEAAQVDTALLDSL